MVTGSDCCECIPSRSNRLLLCLRIHTGRVLVDREQQQREGEQKTSLRHSCTFYFRGALHATSNSIIVAKRLDKYFAYCPAMRRWSLQRLGALIQLSVCVCVFLRVFCVSPGQDWGKRLRVDDLNFLSGGGKAECESWRGNDTCYFHNVVVTRSKATQPLIDIVVICSKQNPRPYIRSQGMTLESLHTSLGPLP